MASNPIYSTDLYQPGPQDTLALLKKELVSIQESVRALDAQARQLKKTLSSGATSPAKVVAAATEAERIASAKKIQLLKEQHVAERLVIETNKRLAVSEQQVAAATSRANIARQREIDYANRAAKANKSHASSLTGVLSSIRSLAIAYFSLQTAVQVFNSILRQTKTLDTLNVAFNTTLGSIQATAQAQEFLLDITERFGANLLGASQAYLKFSAASKQAGVSAEETQSIFRSVTKAASILGLGAERTSFVFLALEQIMSKGRLSTEELRRQLGEHLPGAFGIAAQAMGVTTAKLTDMLKKGEIASTDFLPKFAKQIEIAYGIQNVERIDNLAAAQERFNNQITLLIKDLSLSDVFKDFFNILADGIKSVRESIEAFYDLGKAILYVAGAWAAWRGAMLVTSALMRFVFAQKISEITATNLLAAAQLRLAAATKTLGAAVRANPLGLVLTATVLLIGAIDLLNDKVSATTKHQKNLKDATAQANAVVAKERYEINLLIGAYVEKGKSEEEQIRILNRLKEIGVDIVDSNDDQVISYGELTVAAQKYLVELEKRVRIEALLDKRKELVSAKALIEAELAQPENITRGQAQALFFDRLLGTDVTHEGKAKRRDRIAKEIAELDKFILSQGGDPLGLGGTTTTTTEDDDTTKSKKDPRIVAIDRLIELNKLEEDSLAKRLEAVRLANEKEKILHEKDNEFLLALEKKFYRDLFQVQNEFYAEQQEGFDKQEDREKEAFDKQKEALEKFTEEYIKAQREKNEFDARAKQEYIDGLEDEFDAQQDHQLRLLALSGATDEEIKKAEIEAEIAKLDYILKLHDVHGKELTEQEIKRINELREALGQELLKVGGDEDFDIFKLLGIDFGGDDKKLQALKDTIDFVGEELSNFLDFQKEIVDEQIENADRLVRNAEENLNRQVALAAANQANNVAGAQAELALAKKTQEAALEQRKKTQRQEIILDTISQANNIITAVSAALKLGPILGPIAVGIILGTFAAAKIKAFQLVNKKTFRKGGFEEIKGGSHESGKDTHVGGNNWAENGESVGIFTAKATRKYKPSLKAIVNAANKGVLENIIVQDRRAIQGINMINKTDVDTSLMEKRLGKLVSLSEVKTFVDGRGRLVRIDRGRTTIINK